MLNFKEYFLKEELTVGKHNDGATGAYLPSTWTGSEQLPNNIPGLASTDMVIQDLPKTTIEGKILNIKKPSPSSPFVVEILTLNHSVATYRIDYEGLKRMVVGFTSIRDAIGKKISLVSQGYDKNGNPQVRWGTIS